MAIFEVMTKRSIHIIIVLMSLALIGIIALQAYWIQQGLILGKANFDASVNNALNKTVERLSKQELAITMHGVFSEDGQNEFVSDSSHTHLHEIGEDKTSVLIKVQKQTGELLDEHIKWVEASTENNNDTFFSEETTVSVNIDSHSAQRTTIQSNKVIIAEESTPKRKKLKKVEDLFFNTLVELKASGLKLEDRLDSTEITTLMSEALVAQGITSTDYSFAVRNKAINRYAFVSDQNMENELDQTKHCVRLFEGLGLGEQYELCLYFPNENIYLLGNVGWLALASILFTSIILICFGLSIRTIFHQKKLSEMKNDFINNMTHELKTPLATISLAADSLANPIVHANPRQITHYTEIIKDENSRMHRQVERVLQAARFDRGEIQLKHTPLDIHQLIGKVVRPFQLQLEDREGTLELNLDATSSKLNGDPIHLVNVINNLLDNANKYSPEKPKISLSTRNEGDNFIISVSDKGVGIHPSEQSHIFDRFYRVSSGNLHEVKGFGLGLSYVREIVEAHGGEVSVRSSLGKGSTFVAIFPVRDAG